MGGFSTLGGAAVEIKDVKYSLPDAFAAVLQSLSDADAINTARMLIGAHDYFAEIFNSANITADKAATILNDPAMLVDICTRIFSSAKLSALKIHSILSSVNIAADKVQAILYQMVDLGYISKLNDIITATASNVSITTNTTVTGTVRYRNLTIGSGITLTVDGQPGVIIARNITNNGTITKTATGGAGGAPGAGVGRGGAGGGGLIIVANEVHYGTYNANGLNGENGSTTGSTARGTAGDSGSMIGVGTDAPGNGGAGDYAYGGAGGSPGAGGGGGVTTAIAGGAGGAITLTTIDSYVTIFKEILKQAIDWYIVNVLGKTPTTTKSFYNIYGAGGGGGADYDATGDCGGGGGSGGQIIVVTNIIDGGTFNANGGGGGNGGAEGSVDAAGG